MSRNRRHDVAIELREMKGDIRELKSEMREFKAEARADSQQVQTAIETLSQAIITGFVENEHEHASLERRVARIEAHLKLG